REQQQRLVLRLPAEACDRPVVAVVVRLAADAHAMRTPEDAERGLDGGARALVGENRGVGDLLDQPGAEGRRRNAENDVAGGELTLEVRLFDGAAAGVAARIHAPADDEQRV